MALGNGEGGKAGMPHPPPGVCGLWEGDTGAMRSQQDCSGPSHPQPNHCIQAWLALERKNVGEWRPGQMPPRWPWQPL